MTKEEIKAMLKECTNMTESEIEKQIKNDGVFIYSSKEEFIAESVACLCDEEEAAAAFEKLEKITFNGHIYYVDFML